MRRLMVGFALLALGVTGCGSNPMLTPSGSVERSSDGSREALISAARAGRPNFFPLQTGRFLGYSSSETILESPQIDYALQVVGPSPRVGAGVIEVVDPEARSFIDADGGGLQLKAAAEYPTGGVRRFIRPVRLLTQPLRVGRFWVDNFGSGRNSLHVRHWIADLVTVRTPSGTYRAYQIERRVWQGRHKPDFTADGIGRWTYYYAPGVGPVQIGTRWPGVTYTTYQLTATEPPTLFKLDAMVPLRPASAPWFGLAAGLESLVRG